MAPLLSSPLALAVLERVEEPLLVARPSVSPSRAPEIVFLNRAFADLTGYRTDELVGRTLDLLCGNGREPDALQETREVPVHDRSGAPVPVQCRIERLGESDGSRNHLLLRAPAPDNQGNADQRISQLETLAQVHEEVTAGGLDLDAIRQRIVQIAQAITEADGAATEEPEDEHMVYRAGAGLAAPWVGLRLPLDGSLSGICYRSGRILECTDALTDSRVARDVSIEVGFRSGVFVPLMHGARCRGVLKVFSKQPNWFKPSHLSLLSSVSQVLSSALEAGHIFDAELERRKSLVDALPLLVTYLDADERFREANAAFGRWFGIEPATVIGQRLEGFLSRDGYDSLRASVRAVLRGEPVSFETAVRFPDRRIHYLEGDFIPDRDRHGDPCGFFAAIRDVSDQQTAHLDFLTGLDTRRRFEQQAAALADSARRYDRPLSLLMVDIDHFKSINDGFGHPVGDQVLKAVAGVIKNGVRAADRAARWGGEEFAILAPETTAEEAVELGERIRSRVAARDFPPVGNVTLSVGIAALEAGEDLQTLQKRADKALYTAKNRGRNAVVGYESA